MKNEAGERKAAKMSWVVVGENIAMGEICGVYLFKTERAARKWVDEDIERSTSEPFTKTGHPMWEDEDIDRSDPDNIAAADEFVWHILRAADGMARRGAWNGRH